MISFTKKLTLLGIFQGFYLKVSENLFYKTPPCIFQQGLFKIFQIYVNNKISK